MPNAKFIFYDSHFTGNHNKLVEYQINSPKSLPKLYDEIITAISRDEMLKQYYFMVKGIEGVASVINKFAYMSFFNKLNDAEKNQLLKITNLWVGIYNVR